MDRTDSIGFPFELKYIIACSALVNICDGVPSYSTHPSFVDMLVFQATVNGCPSFARLHLLLHHTPPDGKVRKFLGMDLVLSPCFSPRFIVLNLPLGLFLLFLVSSSASASCSGGYRSSLL